MSLNLRMPEQSDLKPRIIVFGVGGAGGNAVNNMIEKDLQGAEFVVANTDAQALIQSTAGRKIQLGEKVTEGLGAGAKPEIGRASAEESIEEVIDHLAGSHMVFITGGMGGGTGTGAAPIVAQAAREMGILTVGVVTKPFQFEGAKRMRLAEEGIAELQKHVDTLIIIPNQNLFRLANEKTTFTEAFSMADDVLYQGVKGVTDLMVRPGVINLDFADVRSVMDEMGKAMMGTGEATGENRAVEAAEKAIANPLLDEISLKGAKGVLINVTGGHDLTLFELDEAANRIRSEVDPEANIIVGSTLDPDLQDVMRVSVVATGIDVEANARPVPAVRRSEAPARASMSAPAPVEAEPAPAPQQPNVFVERRVADMPPQHHVEEPGLFAQPAPQPQPEPAPRQPETFIAPQAAVPGEPTPETLARLEAAVRKEPKAPVAVQRPEPVEEPRQAVTEERHRRSAIGSLVSRMTGTAEREEPARANPALTPRVQEDSLDEEERRRMEIPAFLRRQAN
ncbi:cell division protein FtsZ [Rubricella aquisinus]|uniref:Cell division protein FtsZ n=1 Tax=Rubricella aquisinus TaxID=2028108 RepID=A0A840X2J3_9RHOB|nr:cell division protein FtsZ [Rubricella aquisinus]MBB5516066.1 cell division protein FtsZ [Rubricella aquisinus]